MTIVQFNVLPSGVPTSTRSARPGRAGDGRAGDSGGPLMAAGKLVGIVSYGDDCNLLEAPSVHADIAYFHDLLTDQMNANG